nr:PREDICTED: CAS1 domain-containing protein 1 [Latimeria chalumnae]|eukprot:XP_006011687.1 PREDICTED: CAS1 domain-containing protein 1 [Latimeria chalumnae]
MAALAYSLVTGKTITPSINAKNAKLLAFSAAVLLAICHSVSRHHGGSDTCDWLLSSGRFLGGNVWQPYGCMMHKYKTNEARSCFSEKYIVFMGDSRIRLLFYSFAKVINPQFKEPGIKHENIPFKDSSASVKMDFMWLPEVNNSMKEYFRSWAEGTASKPHVIIVGAGVWSIKLSNGRSEGLTQYKMNVSSIAPLLETLAESSDVYWVLQDPVLNEMFNKHRKMITNPRIDAYNEAAVSILNSSGVRNAKAKVKILKASRLVASKMVIESEDGMHLPESPRAIVANILMNSYCNKILRPNDASCCLPKPSFTVIQKLTACFFGISIIGFLIFSYLFRNNHKKSKPCTDVESGEEKPTTATPAPANTEILLQSLCKLGLIMAYFYLCDRANLFMKEHKFYTNSTFFVPLIFILMLGVFCNENAKESKLLNRDQTDEWKGWMQLVILLYHISGASSFLPVYMHVRVLVAAYLFQTGYGHFSYFWIKDDLGLYRLCQILFRLNFLVVVLCLVMDRPYQFYYFVPLVTFWFVVIYVVFALWPPIVNRTASGSCFWNLSLLLRLGLLLTCICILAYFQSTFEAVFATWPVSKLFELQGSVHEWWFRWKLDRFAVFHGMMFAFLYLTLQKWQVFSEGNGEPLFSHMVSYCLLFVSVVSFLSYSIWAANCKIKAECNEWHPYISVIQILAFVLIRNIPGYARSVYSTFFAWFGKISLELFICQYHIWLAADTRGILVLIPGNPVLNIIISTFIFVCIAHEISKITNDLVQIAIPKDDTALLKRLLYVFVFLIITLLLSTFEGQLRH